MKNKILIIIALMIGISFSQKPTSRVPASTDWVRILDTSSMSWDHTLSQVFSAGLDATFGTTTLGTATIGASTLTSVTIDVGETLSSVTGVSGVTTSAALNQSVITLTDYQMVITDSEGSGGHGTLKLVDFPIGMIYVVGVVADMAVDSVDGCANNSAFDMALGSATTLTDAETLGNANVDFVAKVDGTLVAEVDTIDLLTNTPQTEDGHTTATDVWLCVAVADANMTATGFMAITGTVTISWLNTGDY